VAEDDTARDQLSVRTELFDYELPEELIAERPPAERDGARLLVLDAAGPLSAHVRDLVRHIPEGALVVLNQTRVRKARLFGRRQGTLGKVELLMLRATSGATGGTILEGGLAKGEHEVWEALGKATSPLREGARIEVGELVLEVTGRRDGGLLVVRVLAGGPLESFLERHGHVPIPPYIRREDEAADIERYQTVFAEKLGSVAAPTAGLHLTDAALSALSARGVTFGRLTLHIGLGTFRPVAVDDLDQHPMHAEHIEISPELCANVEAARARGTKVVAIGTTVVRALASAAQDDGSGLVRPVAGGTRVLIKPGYRFRVVDALLTNFHQPRSTLLALVCAFGGTDAVLSAYRTAIRERYRFLSYGDAMWLPRRA
jgi:S-adenosylmethionine:tRNA ribosyltransferase-isomerase